jgi:hypothetical protein
MGLHTAAARNARPVTTKKSGHMTKKVGDGLRSMKELTPKHRIRFVHRKIAGHLDMAQGVLYLSELLMNRTIDGFELNWRVDKGTTGFDLLVNDQQRDKWVKEIDLFFAKKKTKAPAPARMRASARSPRKAARPAKRAG